MNRPTSARELLGTVVTRYRALREYTDTGRVAVPLTTRSTHETTFTTKLNRDGDFRFAFASPHPYPPLRHRITQYELGRLGGEVYLRSTRPSGQEQVERPGRWDVGVAMATGISGGAAHTIASLLFPEAGTSLLEQLRRPRLRAPQVVCGTVCFQVRGRHPSGGRITLYIGAHDLLLRRLDEHRLRSCEWREPRGAR